MKYIILISLLFISVTTKATTFYISPSGNDANNGSIGSPWKSLYKACNTVSVSGDIIHVNAGTYTETLKCNLAVGVSIEGDGVTSILKTTLTADWDELLSLKSAEGTNGNQHVSGLKFDGQNSTFLGIWEGGRSNVSIHDITMVDFKDRGVIMGGRNDGTGAPPSIYATGCTFYNNTVTNCADYNGFGRGCFNYGGQDGILVYNNTITQDSRAEGHNGWPVKGWNEGWIKNSKFYNNILNKIPMGGVNGGTGWDFAYEMFNESGCEFYSNTLTGGGFDMNFQTKGAYSYSVWIHDNIIKQNTLNVWFESGIILEYGTETAIIEDNTIYNVAGAIYCNPRSGATINTVSNLTIRRNLCYNLGISGSPGNNGVGVGFYMNDNSGSGILRNLYVYNNTFTAVSGSAPFVGIELSNIAYSTGSIDNVNIKNNIVQGFSETWVKMYNNNNDDSIFITNNDSYQNANSNNATIGGSGTPTNYVYTNNINVDPLYVGSGSFHLQGISTLINAGIDVGLPFFNFAPDIGYWEYGNNIYPTANAGADTTIILPTSSLTIIGSGSDADGTIAAKAWTQVSGPATISFTNGTTYSPTLSNLITAGTYVVRITVTDNNGATGSDDRTITVQAAGTRTVQYLRLFNTVFK